MTFEGSNFDILTGASAIVVSYFVCRGTAGRRALFVWNSIGLTLLMSIVVVANVSMPAFRVRSFRLRTRHRCPHPEDFAHVPLLQFGTLGGH